MNRLEALRLASAMVHLAPGALLMLECDGGQQVQVGNHPSADLHPCHWHRVVRAAAAPRHPDHLRHVRSLTLGGSLIDLGAGVYRRQGPAERGCDGDERWFATFLAPEAVGDVLAACPVEGADRVRGILRPDTGMGVTVVTARARGRAEAPLDEVAFWAVAACLAEELIAGAAAVHR